MSALARSSGDAPSPCLVDDGSDAGRSSPGRPFWQLVVYGGGESVCISEETPLHGYVGESA